MFDVLQLQIHSAFSHMNSQICTYLLSKFHKSVFLIGHDNFFVVDAVTDSPKSNHKHEFHCTMEIYGKDVELKNAM